MDAQAVLQGQVDLIGSHGIFAIIATIVVVRIIRNFFYLDKDEAIVTMLFASALVGPLSVYFALDHATTKELLAGVFYTVIGSYLSYEAIKFGLSFAYEKTGIDTLRVLYFFLCPRPIKTKDVKVPPHPTLTQIFDKTRLDK